MAIAYFIPDQAKLLARTGGNRSDSQQHNQSRGSQSATSTGSSDRRRVPARTIESRRPQQEQQQQSQDHRQQQQQEQHRGSQSYTYSSRNNIFRASISIPLPQRQGSMTTGTHSENLNCWELLAQIFCYALRFYNYTSAQRMPTVIQISFEISRGGGETTANRESSPTAGSSSDYTDNGKRQRRHY